MKKLNLGSRFIGLALSVAVVALAGCGQSAKPTPPTAPVPAPQGGQTPGPAQSNGDLPPLTDADKNYAVRIFAGSPGWDHSMPWIAQDSGSFGQYGIKVDFKGGNYPLATQAVQSNQFDVAYLNIAHAIQYRAAGVPLQIAAATTYGSAMIIASPTINKIEDIKGKRVVAGSSMNNTAHLLMMRHILPKYGINEKDVTWITSPNETVGLTLARGDAVLALMIEPQASQAVQQGAKALLDWKEVWPPNGDWYRNCLVLSAKFIEQHPNLAKAYVYAHMDAREFVKQSPDKAIEIMAKAARLDAGLVKTALEKSGLDQEQVPMEWVKLTADDLKAANLTKNDVDLNALMNNDLRQGWKPAK